MGEFLEDGRVCLSNNAAERGLRGIALGRKSWLFCGSDRGGRRAAAMYGLIITAKMNGIDPQAWLAFATLTALEIVLGIDNIIFIAILSQKVATERRDLDIPGVAREAVRRAVRQPADRREIGPAFERAQQLSQGQLTFTAHDEIDGF